MKRILFILPILLLQLTVTRAQSLMSPDAFLGYELGSKFTLHHRVVDYFQHLEESSDKIQLIPYGYTNEGRPLMVAVISTAENLKRIEEIRQNNLILAGLAEGEVKGSSLPIVWLSYNIHGNEASSTETAMKVAHTLISSENDKNKEWLNKSVVVIDPCENPDGRDRYTSWHLQKIGRFQDPNPDTWEHKEPWPGGRFNHYIFDLNRDWAWQTQIESQQRTALYKQWMPHVHVDLHEMSPEAPYFFGPAAEPMHAEITPWQRDFHLTAGRNHAKHFDEHGWDYFTREVFDLFYPSYGDTWPSFNGAVGFTFEQGGHGRAGLAYKKVDGDTLTLKDRIEHHYTSSLSTIEVSVLNAEGLLNEFQNYFNHEVAGAYKTFIIKRKGFEDRVSALTDLLDKQHIRYSYLSSENKTVNGFLYHKNKRGNFKVETGDLVVSTKQPLSKLTSVLFEPEPFLSDSMTYDLTAWALPFAYGVEAVASKDHLKLATTKEAKTFTPNTASDQKIYGFISEWKSLADAQLLAKLLQSGIKARYASEAFTLNGVKYDAGTILILKKDNEHLNNTSFQQKVTNIANELKQSLTIAQTGMVDNGKDFGSSATHFIEKPKVAIVSGSGISPTSFGELWFYFEQQLGYKASIINMNDVKRAHLFKFNTIVLPNGRYKEDCITALSNFVKQGGKVIALEKSIDSMAKIEGTSLSKAYQKRNETKEKEESSAMPVAYGKRHRAELSDAVAGSIYNIKLDNSHPIGFGESNSHFIIKRNGNTYPLMQSAWNVGVFTENSEVSGFVGYKLREKLPNTLSIGGENFGKGQLIYFSESPVFRGFWYSGMQLMHNAVFFKF